MSGASTKATDMLLLSSFYTTGKEYKSDIKYTLPVYENKYNQEVAKTIKNITMKALQN